MDPRNLARMAFLATIITCSTSATRLLDEVPPLEAPIIPSLPHVPPLEMIPTVPVPPDAVIGDGTNLDNPLTFFVRSSVIRGAFNSPTAGKTADPPMNGNEVPSTKPTSEVRNKNDVPHLTVINGDLTEGPEMGSNMVGTVDGFAVEAKRDEFWTSKTVAFTAQFKKGEYADTISFFGVLQNAPETESRMVAVVGGTGRYASATGTANLQPVNAVEQSATEGVGMPLVRVTVNLHRFK